MLELIIVAFRNLFGCFTYYPARAGAVVVNEVNDDRDESREGRGPQGVSEANPRGPQAVGEV